ncbi:MAG: tetratricopeptide repeat protein [Vicinamibacterales bacterium]
MKLLAVSLAFLLAVTAPAAAQDPAVFARAYDLAYNLDHNEAMLLLKKAANEHPNSADANRHVAVVTWLNILFRRGSVTVDSYMGGLTRSGFKLPKPPADLDAGFKAYNQKAIALAEARVRANRHDVDALYDLGTALGLEASYVGTIEGKVGASLRAAKRAFDVQEEVLERDPRRTEAGLIVGTYRYVVSVMSMPVRWAAYIVGFGGGKEHGFRQIEAAAHSPETQTDARFALILLYNREGRYGEALRLLDELRRQYPRNRLLWLERGATSIRAGQGAEAEAVLTEGLRKLDTDGRAKMPGERPLWLYKRGSARVLLRRTADARRDLEMALAQGPLGWVQGRINIELGKTYDLDGDRARAVAHYRQAAAICQTQQDPLCEEDATRLAGSRYR